MKQLFGILTALLICAVSTTAFAENPTCVMLRFSNNTRYKNIDSASVLSDYVIEKLLASGKFNFKETKPIDEDIEARLYDIKTRELWNLTTSLQNKNLNALFEGQGFDEMQAQSIGTAKVGQIITPSITSAIGNAHGAEYLIQGTVINIGSGNWEEDRTEYYDSRALGIAIRTDLRIIKAMTGEVIWRKIITGENTTGVVRMPFIKFGTDKLNSDIYNKAMEDAAKKISNALIEDLTAGKLFAK